MITRICLFCMIIGGSEAIADTLVANRIIPANTIIAAEDVSFRTSNDLGPNVDIAQIVGMEARKAIFAGRPISLADVGVPAIVERNQIIQLVFQSNGLKIKTDGRVLDRAGPGDLVRVMNLASRSIVTAVVSEEGVGFVTR